MSVKRVKLVVAYDGTNYCGWQVQPNGITIEGVLNRELSKLLKEDIVVIGASRTDSGVHSYGNVAVFDTNARILNREFPMPQRRLDTWFVYRKLNIPAMCEAARQFEGTHDFKSFCSVNTAVEDTTRTIYSCELKQDGEVLTIRITGSGFLYNMVRIIAGTLFDVGIGKIAPEDIPAILEKKDRKAAGPTAPAHGLTMIGLEYEILPETLMKPGGKLTEK